MLDDCRRSALLTDLYELTMMAAYFDAGLTATATFELFIRRLPEHRGFLVAAGLEQALSYLCDLRFTVEEIAFVREQPAFKHVSHDFFASLDALRFTGDVWAVPEGTPVFANEPLLRITAPIAQAQLVETYLLAVITFQTMIATKAARCVHAANGKPVIDFGTRRAHGPEAGLLAARAAYLGGCLGTSNVEAGMRYGIPLFGTLAHSFVMAHGSEEQAFHEFSRIFPENTVLLIDTYDMQRAIQRITHSGLKPAGVRIDSGDHLAVSREIRARLDAAGLSATKIYASGDLDEHAIAALESAAAPIDSYAVGTALATSNDAPALSGVYKLVELQEENAPPRAVAKLSEGKATYPYAKQIWRTSDRYGRYAADLVGAATEQHDGAPLLLCVMRGGKRVAAPRPAQEIQRYAGQCLAYLPRALADLNDPAPYLINISEQLKSELLRVRAAHEGTARDAA